MNYHDSKNAENTLKLRELLKTLPPFCREFFLGIKDTTSTRTRLAYAYDLRMFFEYLHENHPTFMKNEITEYDIKILDEIKAMDITEYLDYVSYYETEKAQLRMTNAESSVSLLRLGAFISSSSILSGSKKILRRSFRCRSFIKKR